MISLYFNSVLRWKVEMLILPSPLINNVLLLLSYITLKMKCIPAEYIVLSQCKPYILKPAIVTIDRVAVYHIKTGPKNYPPPATRPT